MNAKPYLPLLFILCFILIANIATATFNVWVTADHHVDCECPEDAGKNQWEDAIEDANSDITFNISLCLGDLVTTRDSPTANNFTENSILFRNYTNLSNMPMECFYHIAGNHEARAISDPAEGDPYNQIVWNEIIDPFMDNPETSWRNASNAPYPLNLSKGLQNGSEDFYTFETGNVLWIMWSPNLTRPHINTASYPDNPNKGQNYSYGIDWFKSIVMNHTDKNIFVCNHLWDGSPLGMTDYATDTMHEINSWLATKKGTHTVAAFLFGHYHFGNPAPSEPARRVFYNTSNDVLYFHTSAIDETHSGSARVSYLLNFTEGSTAVSVVDYRHDGVPGGQWNQTAGNPGTNDTFITLSYAFEDTKGNIAPTQTGETPTNESSYSAFNNTINITIKDANANNMDWSIEVSNGDSNSSTGATNGSIECQVDLDCSTTYTWWVNVTDGTAWTNATYTFTTNNCTTSIIITADMPIPDTLGTSESVISIIGIMLIIGSLLIIITYFKKEGIF